MATLQLPHGSVMTDKIPPVIDGTRSWFEMEELIEDWQSICKGFRHISSYFISIEIELNATFIEIDLLGLYY